MKTSLIIVTYNRPKALEVILKSILKQTQIPHEVIIADDGSEKETENLINKYSINFPCNLKHVWQEDMGFRAAAIRNKAVKASTGEYLIFSDGDLFFNPHFIKDYKRNAAKGEARIGSRVFLTERATKKRIQKQNCNAVFPFFSNEIEINQLNAIRMPVINNFFGVQKYRSNLRGGLLGVWKNDLEMINGWNENFTGWGMEDTELVARLWLKGIKLKKLKFAGITYHLWHPHLSRQQIHKNEELLANCFKSRKSWCDNGLIKDKKI